MSGGPAWRVGIGCLAAFLLMASAAGATTTIKVTTPQDTDASGTGDCLGNDTSDCTLRDAINAANASSGDTISIPGGTYQLAQSAAPQISSSMTLEGAGARTTTIKQTESHQGVLDVSSASATVTVDGVTITGGQAMGSGGGISSGGTLTLRNSTVTGNEADGYTTCVDPPECTMQFAQPGTGGGIYSSGSLTIMNSTVSDNIATPGSAASVTGSAWGGGIYSIQSALRIVNSTVAGNSAQGGIGFGAGGGIFTVAASGSALELASATIAANTASGGAGQGHAQGGNVYLDENNGTLLSVVKDSIVADGTGDSGAENCAGGTLTSAGYNLEDHNQCGFGAAGDQVSKNAHLGQLHNNGGPTDTVALLSGSPAINGGSPQGCKDLANAPIATDQRDVTRPQGSRCDIGAFEFRLVTLAGKPRVSGKPHVGQKLTCLLPAVQSPDGAVTQAVTWLRNGAPAGKGKTYEVRQADAGHSLSCRLVAKNSAGSASAMSSAVKVPPRPAVTITSASATGRKATFKFTTTHATGAECALARKHATPRYSSCTSPKTYSGLGKDSYTFSVRAVGPGGASLPAKHAFTIV